MPISSIYLNLTQSQQVHILCLYWRTALTGSFKNFTKKLIVIEQLYLLYLQLSVYVTRKYLIALIPEVIVSNNFIVPKGSIIRFYLEYYVIAGYDDRPRELL